MMASATSRWRMAAALLVVAALIVTTVSLVDLEPEVSRDFFFASGDPALEEDRKIGARFGGLGQVVIVAASPDISDPAYLVNVERLSLAVEDAAGVIAVHSLARGPDDLEDARESPLWRRLLLAGDGSTSFVIADVQASEAPAVVASLERIVARQAHPEFQLSLAGIPFTVEVMRRQLTRDFAIFSAAAVVVFSSVILVLLRSGWILLGTLVTCSGAVAGTLLSLHVFGFGIGLLTANLVTIVFVLAQSHVVFMASNWQTLTGDDGNAHRRAAQARNRTLRASLGSAATTVLGFGSLLFVPAHPLQELGAGGTLGAVLAFAAAYLLMPLFLERARPPIPPPNTDAIPAMPSAARAAGVAIAVLALVPGLLWLDTDPSLLAYFDEEGDVHRALSTLDRSGGSSPLSLVVQRSDRAPLDREEPYQALWDLQHGFESDPAVGRVVSLPVLVAEARRTPFSFLVGRDWLLDLIGPETTGAFLTRDRRQTLYLLQMSESEREAGRSQVIERLEEIVEGHGFEVPLTGGIYALQARLADLVATSLVWSFGALVLLFVGVAAITARSLRVGIAAGVGAATVPLATLGGFGAFAVPLDVIAAPAASVGLGLAADASLHVISAWRRRANESPRARWIGACQEQWRGVLRSTGVFTLGFALFALSSFPPTQRFGIGVATAAALGTVVALWLVPVLARRLGVRPRG